MPIFEYECQACGQGFEKLVRSHKAKAACPSCSSSRTQRMLSTFAAHGSTPAVPCESGACPASAGLPPGGGCASGKCPFS